jgi:two-component system phosphate regulon sensor histidine kinase PhoR
MGKLYRLNAVLARLRGDPSESTDHEKQLEELRVERDELRERLAQHDAVFSAMADGVFFIDAQGRVRDLNRAAERLFRVASEKALGRAFEEILWNSRLQWLCRRALDTGEELRDTIHTIDTPQKTLHCHLTPMRKAADAEQNGVAGILVVATDITNLERLETIRRDFISNISHELRTPVTSIKGYVETLREDTSADPQARERFLGIIARQAERLGAIIRDMLALARIEQDEQSSELTRTETNVAQLLQNVKDLYTQRITEKGIDLALDVQVPRPVLVNAELIEQALSNLLDNAIGHSKSGGKIRLSARLAGATLCLEVEDTGIGIEERHHARIFERFYRVDKARSREHGGTGLGLSIVKHIALAHGGTVEVQSAIGRGSIFRIILPLDRHAPRGF